MKQTFSTILVNNWIVPKLTLNPLSDKCVKTLSKHLIYIQSQAILSISDAWWTKQYK